MLPVISKHGVESIYIFNIDSKLDQNKFVAYVIIIIPFYPLSSKQQILLLLFSGVGVVWGWGEYLSILRIYKHRFHTCFTVLDQKKYFVNIHNWFDSSSQSLETFVSSVKYYNSHQL